MWQFMIMVLTFAAICHAGDPKIMTECAQEYNLNVDEIASSFMKTGQIPDEENKNAKCMFFCIGKKDGGLNANDDINLEKMKAMIGPKYLSKMNENDMVTLFEKCAADRRKAVLFFTFHYSVNSFDFLLVLNLSKPLGV